jgi:hypothetical protein
MQYIRPMPVPLRLAAAALLVASLSCAHAAITKISDCDQVPTEQRVACAACTVQNQAGGVLGAWEYRPDNDPNNRCVKQ